MSENQSLVSRASAVDRVNVTADSKRAARNLVAAARAEGRVTLDEPRSKSILAAYGISVPRSVVIQRSDELDRVLCCIDPPFALKIISSDVSHKSDVGGVHLNLTDRTAVIAAIGEILAGAHAKGYAVDGFLVEEMVPPGHEIVIGGSWDASFGHMVMFGVGGIFVEILRDVAFRLCPIRRVDATEMIQELRGAAALFGARCGVVGNRSAVIDALMAIAGPDGLLFDLSDEISELDINPLVVSESGVVALDGRIVLRAP